MTPSVGAPEGELIAWYPQLISAQNPAFRPTPAELSAYPTISIL